LIHNGKNKNLINNNHFNYNLNNCKNSLISNSILFTEGTYEGVLNTEALKKKSIKNRKISFSEIAISNSIPSFRSDKKFSNNSNYNNNLIYRNNAYNNHIIYEDDYLTDSNRTNNNKGRNRQKLSSPIKISNTLESNQRTNNSPNYLNLKVKSGFSGKQTNKFLTPIKEKNNFSILNSNQSRNLAYSELTKKTLLPKLTNPYSGKENLFNQ